MRRKLPILGTLTAFLAGIWKCSPDESRERSVSDEPINGQLVQESEDDKTFRFVRENDLEMSGDFIVSQSDLPLFNEFIKIIDDISLYVQKVCPEISEAEKKAFAEIESLLENSDFQDPFYAINLILKGLSDFSDTQRILCQEKTPNLKIAFEIINNLDTKCLELQQEDLTQFESLRFLNTPECQKTISDGRAKLDMFKSLSLEKAK